MNGGLITSGWSSDTTPAAHKKPHERPAQIDELAVRFAARVTAGVAAVVETHEANVHGDDENDFDTPFALRGHHAVEIRNAAAELIRALAGRPH